MRPLALEKALFAGQNGMAQHGTAGHGTSGSGGVTA